MRLQKIILTGLTIVAMLVPTVTFAADEASFSATAPKTTYQTSEEIPVSFSVDGGPYAANLNVIDFNVKISDTTIIEPTNITNPFVAGSIFTSAAIQSYKEGVLNAVVHVNPESKPASRSGVIGTVTFRAIKEGTVTISYDSIQAAVDSKEQEYITTKASSLTLRIENPGSTVNTQSYTETIEPTVEPVRVSRAATSAATGPEDVLLYATIVGMVFFIVFKIFKSMKGNHSRL